jgi:GAF domain-containing protein
LISELQDSAALAKSCTELMTRVVARLSEARPNYNWVGFYMLEPKADSKDSLLVLGPYVGAATPHTHIPLNQGICGAAASRGETVVVDDVNSDPRYLACSIETKSEIVVPVFAHGKVIGELDIDSHSPAAFGLDDRQLCEAAAQIVGKYIEEHDVS